MTNISNAVAQSSKSEDCRRHQFRVIKATALEKNGPTGYPSGHFGLWEHRKCVFCGVFDYRWAPGVDAKNRHGVFEQIRPDSEEALKKRMKREDYLVNLARQHGTI